MMDKLSEIQFFLLRAIGDHTSDLVGSACTTFGVSRQTVNYHLNELIKDGYVLADGKTKARQYTLRVLQESAQDFIIDGDNAACKEDLIWRDLAPLLTPYWHNTNTREIWHYGATEMLNNALEHSHGKNLRLQWHTTATDTHLSIADDGIGALANLQQLNIGDVDDAALALATGKTTTAPDHHSGEGIFFTSRLFDDFCLTANDRKLRIWREHGTRLWALEKTKTTVGTTVTLGLQNNSTTQIKEIFANYQGDNDRFELTEVPVIWVCHDGCAMSRSQARRLLVGAHRFAKVQLDFAQVRQIGQGFADEVFRVFVANHPHSKILPLNTNAAIDQMQAHAAQGQGAVFDILPPPTACQAKYFAHEIKRCGDDVDGLSRSFLDAAIDLTPHQIDAAVFALRNPAAGGVILADEVGLGKTIEAGLVLCQRWAENKRRLLVLCPAALRKQWALELSEKFGLPAEVLDGREWAKQKKAGHKPLRPAADAIMIMSYNFASNKEQELLAEPWDLVIIDEAHKLRSAYREHGMAARIKQALATRRKILLTATPLHNSINDLYGLFSLIDENIFGDREVFRRLFRDPANAAALRQRIQPFLHRRLRSEVQEYVSYTNRLPMVENFSPTSSETKLYDEVSEFLRTCQYAVPPRQRALLILVLRKMLASSPQAIAGTLAIIITRLQKLRDHKLDNAHNLLDELRDNEELSSDWEEFADNDEDLSPATVAVEAEKIEQEILHMQRFVAMSEEIVASTDSKANKLLTALESGFAEMEKLGAARKALIFTESKRTQRYLADFLSARGYGGKIAQFSAQAKDPEVNRIYQQWKHDHPTRLSGAHAIDIRTALTDYFREHAEIMIATEAGGEGINLQFCALVINYDLPWNPQRIEQRIGRCHRYGQKHDVVVINFLNNANEADGLVLKILTDKYKLFSGLFGVSDEILGPIDGAQLEKAICDIYQNCRTNEEIQKGFALLQNERREEIAETMDATRRKVLDHLDDQVQDRLKITLANARARLDKLSRMFWAVTQHSLRAAAEFDHDRLAFDLFHQIADQEPGRYVLLTRKHAQKQPSQTLYRPAHPLGEFALTTAQQLAINHVELVFRPQQSPTQHSMADAMRGKSGWLTLDFLTMQSEVQKDEFVLFSGLDDAGQSVTRETLEELFLCPAEEQTISSSHLPPPNLAQEATQLRAATVLRWDEKRDAVVENERQRFYRWADDKTRQLEDALTATKKRIRQLKNNADIAENIADKAQIEETIKKEERKKRAQRQEIYAQEDEIEEQRDGMIAKMRQQLAAKQTCRCLFVARWRVE